MFEEILQKIFRFSQASVPIGMELIGYSYEVDRTRIFRQVYSFSGNRVKPKNESAEIEKVGNN